MEPTWSQNEAKIEPKWSQKGVQGGPDGDWTRCGVRSPFLESFWCPNGAQRTQKGNRFEAKIKLKIVLISGVEKVGDLEGPRVAKWTLQTSKIIENH